MNLFKACLLPACLVAVLAGCTADGESTEGIPVYHGGDSDDVSSSDSQEDSSSSAEDPEADSLDAYLKMVKVPATMLSRGGSEFDVSEYSIGVTEVTRGLYGSVLELDGIDGEDSLPVTDVNWYEAALFCNALSKKIGGDTAYVYTSIDEDGQLVDLDIDYTVAAVRLPTETEWEVAARAGSTTTYYWGTAEASKYAYYAQSKGPVKVGQYLPNAFGLYDMGGNVAEWTNDWYGTYPTTSKENYTGPENGEYRSVRGGGWSDKVTALASGERDKKMPQLAGDKVGFRIVYSAGF